MQANPTLDQLQVFLAVAETGSFSAAARRLNRAQSVISYTISNLEAQLDPQRFARIHRSQIVNLDRIRELRHWSHGEYQVILHSGEELMLSRSYREKLHELLGGML